ncbi:hypothetical protein DBV15_07719 [Temnothorax longispinosus]|uniref:Uncharacterized protein n=1 Tax=Temnothorax longispinosus TaxID=300112 RepID=A0A4S2KR04_9HYME|nr:hypothetical protein DBV15_07719 [Temnothorax longispinosus]
MPSRASDGSQWDPVSFDNLIRKRSPRLIRRSEQTLKAREGTDGTGERNQEGQTEKEIINGLMVRRYQIRLMRSVNARCVSIGLVLALSNCSESGGEPDAMLDMHHPGTGIDSHHPQFHNSYDTNWVTNFHHWTRAKLIMTAAVRHKTLKSSLAQRVEIDRFHQFGCRFAVFPSIALMDRIDCESREDSEVRKHEKLGGRKPSQLYLSEGATRIGRGARILFSREEPRPPSSCALARATKLSSKGELSAASQARDQELSEATNPLQQSELLSGLIGRDSAQERRHRGENSRIKK